MSFHLISRQTLLPECLLPEPVGNLRPGQKKGAKIHDGYCVQGLAHACREIRTQDNLFLLYCPEHGISLRPLNLVLTSGLAKNASLLETESFEKVPPRKYFQTSRIADYCIEGLPIVLGLKCRWIMIFDGRYSCSVSSCLLMWCSPSKTYIRRLQDHKVTSAGEVLYGEELQD